MPTVTFFGWWQPPGAQAITSGKLNAGRLSATLSIKAVDLDDQTEVSKTLSYDLMGPGDVINLSPEAIVHTYPSNGASQAEVNKSVYAELASPDLPWRYTVARPSGKALLPWIVLLVGTPREIELSGKSVRLQPAVLDAHPLSRSARFSHVEQSAQNRAISRILSSRTLQSEQDYIGVIVPAFTASGQPSWLTPAPGPVELPLYHHWHFRTRRGGDFATLSRRLKLRRALPELGSVKVEYGPLGSQGFADMFGVLRAVSARADAPVDQELAADLQQLTVPLGSATRPVLGLPDLSAPWTSTDSSSNSAGWRQQLRADFRARAAAGLGVEAAIVNQELLSLEAGRAAGAYAEAMDRLRRLSLGLLVSRSLWKRRVPQEPVRRLSVLGAALPNVLTDTAPVAEQMEHPDRALERSLFAPAAMRALRRRNSADTLLNENTSKPISTNKTTLALAAARPPRHIRAHPNALHTDVFSRAHNRTSLDVVLSRGELSVKEIAPATTTLVDEIRTKLGGKNLTSLVDRRLATVTNRAKAGKGIAYLPLLQLAKSNEKSSSETIRTLTAALDVESDAQDLAMLGMRVARAPIQPTSSALSVEKTSNRIATVFDPTVAKPSIVDRVLDTVNDSLGSVSKEPSEPVELSPELNLASWKFLEAHAPEWLLPGANSLPDNSVVALATNPGFVDAFLVGLNAQLMAELRFRNYPVIPEWTPVRTFWDRVSDNKTGADNDIVGIESWSDRSALGAKSHQTASSSRSDLVLLFSTALFREYPGTLVYLVPAKRRGNGTINWKSNPDYAERQLPVLQGQLSSVQRYFGFDLEPEQGAHNWIVLEESVKGRRFFNDTDRPIPAAKNTNNGAEFARDMVCEPRRFLIRGDSLLGGEQS